MPTVSRCPPSSARQWLAAALLLALLWAQALGLAHRTAHGPVPALAVAAVAVHHHEHRGPQADAGLFGHEQDQAAQCRLFDQLALGEPLAPSATGVVAEPPRAPAVPARDRVARASATTVYEARAPPSFA